MTHKDILKALKKKDYQPIYFLYGNEPYYIDYLSNYIEKNVLTEDEKAFNQTILYGKETSHLQIVDAARRYPIMAERQVILLKEAQNMKNLSKLEKYIQHPMPTTLLVICYKHKKFDKRTKFAKALTKKAVVFESKKLYDNKIPDWAIGYLKEKGYQLAPNAAELLTEFLGTNLSKIANELDKLMINLSKDVTITVNHIRDNIGISKDYNVFELQNALARKDIVKAQRIIYYFKANPKKNPLVVVIGSLYNFFSKVYIAHFYKNVGDKELAKKLGLRSIYFLKQYKTAASKYNKAKTEQIISLLREYDLKSKGVNRDSTPESALMQELVYGILH